MTEYGAAVLASLILSHALVGAVANAGFVNSSAVRLVLIRLEMLELICTRLSLPQNSVTLNDLHASFTSLKSPAAPDLKTVFHGYRNDKPLEEQLTAQLTWDESLWRSFKDVTLSERTSKSIEVSRATSRLTFTDEARRALQPSPPNVDAVMSRGMGLMQQRHPGYLAAFWRQLVRAPKPLWLFMAGSVDRWGRGVTLGVLGACLVEGARETSTTTSLGSAITVGTAAGVALVVFFDWHATFRAVSAHARVFNRSPLGDVTVLVAMLLTPCIACAIALYLAKPST